MRYLMTLVVLLLLFPVSAFGAEEESSNELAVLYLEFPPYYYTERSGEPSGLLLQKADEVFRRAGLEVRYKSMSAKRVMQELRSIRPTCSIGWFKTAKRERFAKFSKPIYQNEPLQVLYLKKNEHRFQKKTTLVELLADDSLTLGLVEEYSLGGEVDDMISRHGSSARRIQGDYPHLVRLLAAEEFSYILVAPEEIDVLISKNYLAKSQFAVMHPSDMPAGNKRYLLFGLAVPDSMIQRIDNAIDSLGKLQ